MIGFDFYCESEPHQSQVLLRSRMIIAPFKQTQVCTYIVHGSDLLGEVLGGDVQDVGVGRVAVRGQRLAAAPRVSAGRGPARVHQLLDQRRVLCRGILADNFPFPLDFGVQLRAGHNPAAEGL